MVHLLVHHHVEDYKKWKPVFDEHASDRSKAGSKGAWLFRNANDPNDVFAITQWDNIESAKKFGQSDSLKAAMERGGVQGAPEVYFLEEIGKQSA
jgi:heme-degrading monooxygenase HmoA